MSNSILITYATRFSSTAEVAEVIGEVIGAQGLSVTMRPMEDVHSLDGYRAVLLGSAVNYGKWIPSAVQSVRKHQRALGEVPVALFTVHIQNIGDDEQSKRSRLAYLDDVRPYVKPVAEAFFAGRFNRHAAVELIPRWLAMFVPTFDLRKWDKIRAWANDLPVLLFPQAQTSRTPVRVHPRSFAL